MMQCVGSENTIGSLSSRGTETETEWQLAASVPLIDYL